MQVVEKGGTSKYRVKCEYCGCKFEYFHSDLGFRAWYPHGFVYCPHCRKPLRHKLEYIINPDGKTPMEGSSYPVAKENTQQVGTNWLCSCGTENDGNFCTKCGQKRVEAVAASWFCSACGTRNDGNFCSNCGKKKT